MKILRALFLVIAVTFMAAPAFAAAINDKGVAGVCVAVTTGAPVQVLGGKPSRTTATIYATQAMNCMQGDSAGNAPAIAPTTGAIGTGVGYPFAATTYITLGAGRSIDVGATGGQVNLDPGARLDCIAQTVNGNVCTWGQF